ncbi:MAG: hypothetical protein U0R79_07095 [Propionicimonas sp.]
MRKTIGSLLAALLLVGCATTQEAAPSPTVASPAMATSPATSAAPAEPARTVIRITLADGKVDPNGQRVELARGSVLELVITSDREDAVHVHGFDLEIPVTPGASVTKDITLDRVGRFEIESHEPVFTILQLVVS